MKKLFIFILFSSFKGRINPQTLTFTIINVSSEIALDEISIYDLTGKNVWRTKAEQQRSFDLLMLIPGFYVVVLSIQDGSSSTLKLIKE
jgi:hypothetical protein